MPQSPIDPGTNLALSWLEVLDDECHVLSQQPLDHSAIRIAYLTERNRCYEAGLDLDLDPQFQAARIAYRHEVISRLHAAKRSALCFSGGGIRSATFGLGVMQGLAAHSETPPGERPKLLGEFDYLSTVSGGGYLGGWFSSWATRAARKDKDGAAEAIHELASVPETDFDPEPREVRHLRTFSNYLIPKLGLLSGDTLAALNSVIRNIVLNWLILIPLLAAVLLIPVLAQFSVWAWSVPDNTEWVLMLSGLFATMLATGYVGYDLPSAGNARGSYVLYLWCCLLPLMLAAMHFSMFWVWLEAGTEDAPFWNLVALGRLNISWMHFAGLGALMHGGGMLCGVLFAKVMLKQPPTTVALASTLVAGVTGSIGGLFGWLITRPSAQNGIGDERLYAILGFPAVILMFLISGTLLVGGSSYFTKDRDREWWARSGGWLMAVAISWLTFALVVLFSTSVLHQLKLSLISLASGTGLAGWAVSQLGGSSDTPSGRQEERAATPPVGQLLGLPILKQLAARLILPVFLLLLVMLLSTCNDILLHFIATIPSRVDSFWPAAVKPIGDATAHVWWLALAYVALCATASYFINVNTFSLHAMYRERLIRAYLGASNRHRNPHPFTGFDENDDMPMCNLTSDKPMHVVNMALNLVGGDNLAWQQRKAESFTCTRLYTGSARVGYRSSAYYGGHYRSGKSPISLGTAITISGAAASPNMGYHSSALLTMVMTLFNARLGWWLGNPGHTGRTWKQPGPNWGVRPFIDESFGFTDDQNPWIYLSDGGHFENLAIYEMIMRRCATIVVSDAGADAEYTYEDLGNAVRKIRIDLGIPIDFGYRMPMWPSGGATESLPGYHCAIGVIHYEAVDGNGVQPGLLVYLKPSLNGNEPADVQHYASSAATFPHQATPDQFFDEAQFESYRRLGLHVIEEIIGSPALDEHGDPVPRTLNLAEFVSAAQAYSVPVAPQYSRTATASSHRGD